MYIYVISYTLKKCVDVSLLKISTMLKFLDIFTSRGHLSAKNISRKTFCVIFSLVNMSAVHAFMCKKHGNANWMQLHFNYNSHFFTLPHSFNYNYNVGDYDGVRLLNNALK